MQKKNGWTRETGSEEPKGPEANDWGDKVDDKSGEEANR